QPPPPHKINPAVPPALSGLVVRLLAKRREDRPASAAAVADALEAVEPSLPQGVPRRRTRWAAALVTAPLLAALAGAPLPPHPAAPPARPRGPAAPGLRAPPRWPPPPRPPRRGGRPRRPPRGPPLRTWPRGPAPSWRLFAPAVRGGGAPWGAASTTFPPRRA